MITLTDLEIEAIKIIAKNGMEEIGAKDPIDMLTDNFSWFNAADIMRATKWNGQKTGGVMSSLQDKGLICGDPGDDFALTDDGIQVAQDNF